MLQGKHNVCGTSRQVVSALAGIVTLPKLLVYSFQERRNLHLYHENAQEIQRSKSVCTIPDFKNGKTSSAVSDFKCID